MPLRDLLMGVVVVTMACCSGIVIGGVLGGMGGDDGGGGGGGGGGDIGGVAVCEVVRMSGGAGVVGVEVCGGAVLVRRGRNVGWLEGVGGGCMRGWLRRMSPRSSGICCGMWLVSRGRAR